METELDFYEELYGVKIGPVIEDLEGICVLTEENVKKLNEAVDEEFKLTEELDKRKHYRLLNLALGKYIEFRDKEKKNHTRLYNENKKSKKDEDKYYEDLIFSEAMISVFETIIAEIQKLMKPYLIFNRSLFVKNIRFLLNYRDIKTGAFENDAMVSTGYISRLESGKFDASPTIEFVMHCSKLLTVSIDTLLNIDLTEYEQEEMPILEFISELKEGTYADRYKWSIMESNSPDEITDFLPPQLVSDFSSGTIGSYSIFRESDVSIIESAITTKLSNGFDIYFIPIKYNDGKKAIEIYLYNIDDGAIGVCTTSEIANATSKAILDAYHIIKNIARKKKQSDRGISIIKDYLSNLKK